MSPRIRIEPGKRSGQACIRGLRITVWDCVSDQALYQQRDEFIEESATRWWF